MSAEKLDKIIVQSILTTLGGIFALCVIAFAVVALAFPSTLMQISYQFGNDSGAMKYAKRAYKNSGEIYYIAYATEVAIGIEENEDIEEYAQMFIQDSDTFTKYCEELDTKKELAPGSYRQYVYGQLVLAEYAQGKADEAFAHADEAIGTGFPHNNAYVALLFAALQNEDDATLLKIIAKMQSISLEKAEEREYLDKILGSLDQVFPTS